MNRVIIAILMLSATLAAAQCGPKNVKLVAERVTASPEPSKDKGTVYVVTEGQCG